MFGMEVKSCCVWTMCVVRAQKSFEVRSLELLVPYDVKPETFEDIDMKTLCEHYVDFI